MKPRAAFTLLEVMAVVLLTSLVIGAALSHYVNLSRASARASEHTREVRRAALILDRVARDLERTVLFRVPEETDPIEHPWIFCAEPHHAAAAGADSIKFVTRGRALRRGDARESDLEVVAYSMRRAEDGSFELMRWSSPRLEDGLGCEFPSDESQGAVLLADGLADFGALFLDELGASSDRWDSSQLVESSELPVAVDLQVALAAPDAAPLRAELEPLHYRRRVLLPLRPFDLEELLDPNSAVSGGSGEGEGEQAEGEDSEIKTAYEEALRQCRKLPCAGQSACQAIRCDAKEGLYGHSSDVLLRVLGEENTTFCTFWAGSESLRWLIDNPACR